MTLLTDLFPEASTGGGFGWSPVYQAANYTAASGEQVFINSAAAVRTVTLPASPSAGDKVRVTDTGSAATNNVTVGRNGQTINGGASDFTINRARGDVVFVFNGVTWDARWTSGIKSIQRGTISHTAATTASTTNATISSVDTSRAVVSLLGWNVTSSQSGSLAERDVGGLFPRIKLTNATTLTVDTGFHAADGSYTLTLSYEVVEYY